jgi:hypothetical protein
MALQVVDVTGLGLLLPSEMVQSALTRSPPISPRIIRSISMPTVCRSPMTL